ncbi:MAG TPA: hypothetical protein VF487_08070 [Chitinophagaceae bacterium]
MKIIINFISIILFVCAAASVNRVNAQQQRPSQRSFVAVLAKIKEKKEGRNKILERSQPPVDKTSTVGENANPVPPVDKQLPAAIKREAVPASQQKIQLPPKPKHN